MPKSLAEAAKLPYETLFTREDAVEAAWTVVDPVLANHHRAHPYKRRTWGPEGGRQAHCPRRYLAQPRAGGSGVE
jgi:glucose-6-phosphate 1-dehydrogenase